MFARLVPASFLFLAVGCGRVEGSSGKPAAGAGGLDSRSGACVPAGERCVDGDVWEKSPDASCEDPGELATACVDDSCVPWLGGDNRGRYARCSVGDPATGGTGTFETSPFACGCLEGSDAGLVLEIEGGEEIVFSDPPRFHKPDTLDGITWLFECDDAQTPIYFDSKCEFLDIVEACHLEEGCLQIQEDKGFKWLSTGGEVMYEGESTFDYEYVQTGDDVSLDHVMGTLTDEEGNFSATFAGDVCDLHRDDCMR